MKNKGVKNYCLSKFKWSWFLIWLPCYLLQQQQLLPACPLACLPDLLLTTCFMQLTIYYSLHTTQHELFITHDLQFAMYYLLLQFQFSRFTIQLNNKCGSSSPKYKVRGASRGKKRQLVVLQYWSIKRSVVSSRPGAVSSKQ